MDRSRYDALMDVIRSRTAPGMIVVASTRHKVMYRDENNVD